MMTDTTAPRARRALDELDRLAAEPECDPAVYDAAHVLAALCTAADRVGGEDTHVLHWLNRTRTLTAPRKILGKLRTDVRGRRSSRPLAAHLVAYESGSAQARRTICDIITTMIERAEA
ncbi:hypothetical protein ACOQFV_24660 [Nocardiopsis changdeensis]|uniref:DUF222 domain-containing protein n=1 Tax=Nocardiopsis changdeensis TaxID=2831969 RepID=A0A975KTX5_9ACTN|nr:MULTISPECIES: hypothetical protein [Nocardiopsis]QUX26417.1 hypothetical protein KGD84_32480 [Nocardiopsis changdeensis]QYX40689.1 hypothetical protein K1J57_32330 [Nocardiopsis sp. MT53]